MALQQGPSAATNNAEDQAADRLREAFVKELQHFHDTRGTPFKKLPKVSGKEVDLYKLYTVVTSRGGWIAVNSKNEWAWLCEEFHLPSGCVNSGVGLKQIYLRYLDRYEKVHFLGEDGHQADDDDEDSRHRKWNARSLHSVPHTYNHHQHNVAETLREYNGLSSNLYKPSNYDKLALSLLSPLPNEHDFAINVCTILSTEGKHTLRLDQYPRLVNHLLAHAGVYDSPGTRQLFIEVYSRVRNYSINSFWQDVLESRDMLDLTDERAFAAKPKTAKTSQKFVRRRQCDRDRDKSPEPATITLDNDDDNNDDDEPMDIVDDYNGFMDQNQNSIKFEDDDRDLFCVGRTLGTQDPFGQRVLQIASILRNLSFTPENAAILAKSRSFLRFVLLCVRSRWSNLHQLGFDTLGNIANEIILKEAGERITNLILSCVTKGVDSQDRFIVISSLEILNKISQQDLNEETLSLGLDDNVYDMICRFLALSDIALLVYTLECLYALTSLGERPCTSVARVRGAIDTLVALVTVEAQSYGPKACILMRVVETVSAVPASQQQQQQASSPASTTVTVHNSTPTQQITSVTASPVTVSTQQQPQQQQPQIQTVTQVQPVQVQAQVVQQPVAVQVQVQPQPSQQVQAQPQTTPVKVVTTTASKPAITKAAAAKAAQAASSLATAHTHQQIIQENEQFALGWLRATFEPAQGVKIEQDELYKKYFGCCTKIGRKGVIAPLHFPRCVRNVFGGSVGPNHMKGESSGPLFYEGIKIRENPGQVTYPSQQIVSSSPTGLANNSAMITTKVQLQQRNDPNTNTVTPSSPILKAQLSAPPKPNPTTTTTPSSPLSINAPSPATTYEPKSQVSSSHPHLSQALLGSGGNNTSQQASSQQQQQQQQQVQVIVKDSNGTVTATTAAATSSSIIKSLLATKVTVGGECMPSAAGATTSSIPCVQQTAVTNATGVISSISANQLLTANQVAQRQQQQQQQRQQQQITIVQTPTKTPVNAKAKPTTVAVKKVQRLNGAKIIVANNCEKVDASDSDTQTQLAVASITTDSNHVTAVIRKPNQSSQQRNVCTPIGEDSDSTNNSLASSSGIGGSRDCSGAGAGEENSLTSFEGILLNGAPSNLDADTQEDGSSKDSSSISSKEKPMQSMMLADLLERKMDKEPVLNGILGKKDLVENHIKKVLKESPTDMKIKAEVSEDALIEAPARVGIKRSASTDTEEAVGSKKLKYSNGTSSPDPATIVTNVKSEDAEEEKDEKVTVSSTAANLYAALAADIIEDETDLEEPAAVKEESKPAVKEETPVKVEPTVATAPTVAAAAPEQPQQQQQQAQIQQRVQTPTTTQPQTIAITQQQLQQSGLLVGPRQIVVQQTIQQNNQIVTIPASALKGRTQQMQPQVLQVQQGAGGQTHYVISGGVGGQNYVLAQPQTALVQGQAQTVLVAQQQGTNTKTIIILQPQAAAQAQPQKVVAVTPQGQQVVVTQMPRPQLVSSSIGSIPPPLVPTSGSIVVSQAATTTLAQSQPSQGTIAVVQPPQTTATSAVPVRVVTPTPASTPPTSRPATPQVTQTKSTTPQPASPAVEQAKETKVTDNNDGNSNSSSGAVTDNGKQTTSSETAATTTTTSTTSASASTTTTSSTTTTTTTNSTPGPKTITIKMNPKAFLCEWRGCLKQFKTPRKVYLHAIETHCPTGDDEALCLWASCDGLKRRRFSLMTHLFDRHCMESVMLMRRKQLTSSEKTELPVAPPPTPITPQQQQQHPGYAPNAAFHAIKRHALEFVNPKELMQRPSKPAATTTSSSSPRPGQNPPPEQDDNEGPVTKSIRLTAALILRNLVIYSAHGRRHLRAYEPHLAGVALSNVESSRTIAQVLYDMNDQSSSGHR